MDLEGACQIQSARADDEYFASFDTPDQFVAGNYDMVGPCRSAPLVDADCSQQPAVW